MDIFDIKLEEINEKLIKRNRGFLYDLKHDRENGLILPFFAMYMNYANKNGLDFCFTTKTSFECGIIHDDKLIFMSYGTFDRLCKLAELIVRSGVITGKTRELNFFDLHLVEKPFVGFNNEERDETESESHLFMFILNTLMFFVFSHEVGHFVNRHGERNIKNTTDNIFDDVIGHKFIDKNQLISSHARELVADCYALNSVKKYIQSVFNNQDDYINNLVEDYKTKEGPVLLSLLLILCYFKLTDGLNDFDHFESTHPSTAARMRFIISCHIESLNAHDDDIFIDKYLTSIIDQCTSIFASVDAEFGLKWIVDTSTDEMTEWFNEVHKEYPKWTV
jgi:hypothetical protein